MMRTFSCLYPVKVKGARKEYENAQKEDIKCGRKDDRAYALEDRDREDDLNSNKPDLLQPRLE